MSIVGYLKNFIPMDVMFRVKYYRELHNKKTLQIKEGKHIFFLDAPDYGNVGDQAIAYAIYKFADKYFSEYQFVEILQKDVASYLDFLRKNIKQGDVIFLTGGGNMGNYYRIYEATRRIIIDTFKNNQIVIFPQSIMYSNDFFGRLSLNKAKRVYNGHPNLVVCAREKISFDKMNRIFKDVILCPDIVLSLIDLFPCFQNSARKTIGLCLRDDIEQSLNSTDRNRIKEQAEELKQGISTISTVEEHGIIDFNNRESVVVAKIKQIANCSALVTDRLHAMIFSVISRTPCLVFNNSNSKIAGTLSWLNDYQGVMLLDSTENIKDKLSGLLEHELIDSLNLDYSALIERIGK